MLTAYYPAAPFPEPTVRAWAAELRAFDADDVANAIRRLASTEPRCPSLAQLIGEARNEMRRRLAEQTPALADDAVTPTPERMAANAERARGLVDELAKRRSMRTPDTTPDDPRVGTDEGAGQTPDGREAT